nr:retrovirus-related Pol polyprotein from transposon TNT 1-94 [Tanacetum cinerariifolium]
MKHQSVGISHQVSSVRIPHQNGVVERRNWTLVEAARTMLIFSRAPLFLWAEAIATACFTQNCSIIHYRFNKTPYELINKRKPDISFLHVFGALCYPKNDHEDIGKLGAKGLDLTYAQSTITTQQPTEGELDLLFEAMYDDYIGGQPSSAPRTVPIAQAHQVRQTPTTSTSIADTAPTPTNSSSQATIFPNTSQDVDGLTSQQQHAQQQGHQAPIQPETVADNVLNAMFGANTFVNPFATPSTSVVESSSLQYVDPSNMHTFYQPYPHEFQWTKDHPLEQDSGFELTGFLDADYAGCKDTFKSTSGGAQFLGEKLVSWSLKKQDNTTLLTAKAEYVSLSACCAQVLWMWTQLTDYGFHFNKIPICCDSKSAIAISCNPVQHSRTKHIVVRYHFIKEHVEKGTIELYFVKTNYQLADLFTKALPVDRFNYLVRRLDSSAAGTDNRPPMLEENDYESWRICIERYIKGKPHGKLIWKSIQNRPTPYPQTTDPATEGGAVPPSRNKRDKERKFWVNLELLMKGSGQTLERRKEALFDEFEHFRANGNELIQDYFVRFHKLVNDMKVIQLDIPTHQLNTKFANNLPSTYEEHALKSLKKKEQSSVVVDPLAYLAKTTPTHSTTSPVTVPTPQSSSDSHNDAMLATINQIANLLSGLQKQFPPTNNQLWTSSNPMTHATVYDRQIDTETVQRRASGNTRTKGIQTTGSGVNNSGKKVICYSCRGEGHVARQCKEPKCACNSQWYHDKALLMQAKEKGAVLDVEAKAFLVDVESFMANLSSTCGINGSSSSHINQVQISDDSFFSDVSYPLAREMQQEEQLNSEVDSMLDDNMITYDEYQNDSGVETVPTVVSADEADKQSMIAVLQHMHTEITVYVKVNDKHKLVNATLSLNGVRSKCRPLNVIRLSMT